MVAVAVAQITWECKSSYHHFQLISSEKWQHRDWNDMSHAFPHQVHLVVKLMQPSSQTHVQH